MFTVFRKPSSKQSYCRLPAEKNLRAHDGVVEETDDLLLRELEGVGIVVGI